ncbi:MAG: hypothetical protein K6T75_10670 [Acetobacteraceae bacterium]|nr:hypothetical protein [Acetobacteraceae bacterium]
MPAAARDPRSIPIRYGAPAGATDRGRRVDRVGDGSIIVRFDKTPAPSSPRDVVCPHFLELKWATGCPFRCAWCYLQGTLRFLPAGTRPRVKDLSRVEAHLRAFLEHAEGPAELLNTGELSDSLMWEKDGQAFSRMLVRALRAHGSGHRALLVTKSCRIENLLADPAPDALVVSFSLNAHAVARRWERGAPPVALRIDAARRLQHAGYEVRVRIDPLVPIPGWQKAYRDLVDQVRRSLQPSRVTLGSLRGLVSTVNRARDKSWVGFLSEPSGWGRRVALKLRLEMYRLVLEHLGRHGINRVALCKETLEAWDALGLDRRSPSCNCVP